LGAYDTFRQLLGERSTADVNTGQAFRRRQVSESFRQRRETEARVYLRTKKRKQRSALAVGQPVSKAGVPYDPISEIFGFTVIKKKRRSRRR